MALSRAPYSLETILTFDNRDAVSEKKNDNFNN